MWLRRAAYSHIGRRRVSNHVAVALCICRRADDGCGGRAAERLYPLESDRLREAAGNSERESRDLSVHGLNDSPSDNECARILGTTIQMTVLVAIPLIWARCWTSAQRRFPRSILS